MKMRGAFVRSSQTNLQPPLHASERYYQNSLIQILVNGNKNIRSVMVSCFSFFVNAVAH